MAKEYPSWSKWKLSNEEELQKRLKEYNKSWDVETNELEDLDEFAHLPQKIDNSKIIREYCDQWIYSTPSKYKDAYIVQPKLLQQYEAWKDEVDFNFSIIPKNKWCIILINNTLTVHARIDMNYLFAFKTEKKAERFLELFRTELELYKPLMGGQ